MLSTMYSYTVTFNNKTTATVQASSYSTDDTFVNFGDNQGNRVASFRKERVEKIVRGDSVS